LRIAVYPGSFDPITNGHIDIASRAAKLFDQLIIAIYDRPAKDIMFPLSKRVQMAEASVAHLRNVKVDCFSSLTVDYAQTVGATALVRGLRAISDFELELQMAHMNRKMAPELEVICLMTSFRYSFLSSRIVKEVAKLGGGVDGLVPDHVARALREACGACEG
jgi:pantetheine-phosphate adenylyltransferase